MRLFTTVFELVKLPLIVAKDVVTALPDASMGKGAFQDTKDQCEKIDEEISR